MQVARFRYNQDWAAGSFNGAYLDTVVNVSQYGHPAVVPGSQITSTVAHSGVRLYEQTQGTATPPITSPTGITLSNVYGQTVGWTTGDLLLYTTTAGDALSFTTTAQQVTLYLAGVLTAGLGDTSGALAVDASGTLHTPL